MPNTYSVYNRKNNDMPVIIGGTAKECAAVMGLTIGSFRSIYTKIKNGQRASYKWEIHQDEEIDPEEEHYEY